MGGLVLENAGNLMSTIATQQEMPLVKIDSADDVQRQWGTGASKVSSDEGETSADYITSQGAELVPKTTDMTGQLAYLKKKMFSCFLNQVYVLMKCIFNFLSAINTLL